MDMATIVTNGTAEIVPTEDALNFLRNECAAYAPNGREAGNRVWLSQGIGTDDVAGYKLTTVWLVHREDGGTRQVIVPVAADEI